MPRPGDVRYVAEWLASMGDTSRPDYDPVDDAEYQIQACNTLAEARRVAVANDLIGEGVVDTQRWEHYPGEPRWAGAWQTIESERVYSD